MCVPLHMCVPQLSPTMQVLETGLKSSGMLAGAFTRWATQQAPVLTIPKDEESQWNLSLW